MTLIKCGECGKQVSNRAKSCPHCGNPIKEEIIKKVDVKTNSYAIAGFVLSIVAWLISPYGLMAIVSTFLSAHGIDQINKSKGKEKGKGLAVFGLIFSILVFFARIYSYLYSEGYIG